VAGAEPEVDEDAVLAVVGRTAERLAVDRYDPRPLLARGFGDQLLHPRPEGGHPLGRDQRELVAAGPGERAEHGAEAKARVLARAVTLGRTYLLPEEAEERVGLGGRPRLR